MKEKEMPLRENVGLWAVIIDGALLAMMFDWLMEPVAIKLGYWTWLTDGGIPTKNYWDWFFVSAFLMIFFRLLKFHKNNQFALHLLLIQTLFFISLRILL
jgi:putative membrane protein